VGAGQAWDVIIREKMRPAAAAGRAGAAIDGWAAGLPAFTPDEVETLTGVAAPRVERLANEFAAQAPAVAIVGGAPLAHANGLFNALAVNALNALVGSIDQPGGLFFTPQINVGAARAVPQRFELGALLASPPQVLLIDGANPVFSTPPAMNVRETLIRVPFIASFGHFLDETSILSDLILPDHTFLESWTDALPESGSMVAVISAAPPVMAPLYDTRATTDLLLEVGRQLSRPVELPWQSFEEMLTATFAQLPAEAEGSDAWTEAQEKGGWWGTLPVALTASTPPAGVTRTAEVTQEPVFDGDAGQFPLHLLPYASSTFLDGSTAHLPWLQEMPDPMTSARWSSWVEINPATAERLGINTGDVVEIASAQGTMQSAAVVSPGIAPDIVAMPAGQGHKTFTRYASGRGENPVELLASANWAATRVKVTRIGGPDGRLILFAGGDRDHDGTHQYGHAGRG